MQSEKRDIRLYLDTDSIDDLQELAASVHVSASGFVRILFKLLNDKERISWDTPMEDAVELIRNRIAKYVLEEYGRE